MTFSKLSTPQKPREPGSQSREADDEHEPSAILRLTCPERSLDKDREDVGMSARLEGVST